MTVHPSNADIQAAIVAKLKAATNVTALVPAVEIRENQWQGVEFDYPNIRVRMISNTPQDFEGCDIVDFTLGVQVHSEEASSYQADRIAGIIQSVLHGHPWSTADLLITLRTSNLVPAIRSDARTWRAEVLMTGLASKS